MLSLAAAVPASTAIQQAQSASDLHFYVTTAVIGAGVGLLGWLFRRLIGQNDQRFVDLGDDIKAVSDDLRETNKQLAGVTVGLASLTGQLAGAERANVRERQRVQKREPEIVDNAAQAKEAAEQAARDAAETKEKLDEIHGLVNSNLTASKQANLDGARRELFLLKAIKTPTAEEQEAIVAAEDRIAELEQDLAHRNQTEREP
jgi:hypothetical protein